MADKDKPEVTTVDPADALAKAAEELEELAGTKTPDVAKSLAEQARGLSKAIRAATSPKAPEPPKDADDDEDEDYAIPDEDEDEDEDIEEEDEDEPEDRASGKAVRRSIQDSFYKSLADDDEVAPVIEASEAIERLADTVGKGFGSLEDQVADLQRLVTAQGKVLVALAKSMALSLQKLEAIEKTPMPTPSGALGVLVTGKNPSNGQTVAKSRGDILVLLEEKVRKGQLAPETLARFNTWGVDALPEEIRQELGLSK